MFDNSVIKSADALVYSSTIYFAVSCIKNFVNSYWQDVISFILVVLGVVVWFANIKLPKKKRDVLLKKTDCVIKFSFFWNAEKIIKKIETQWKKMPPLTHKLIFSSLCIFWVIHLYVVLIFPMFINF